MINAFRLAPVLLVSALLAACGGGGGAGGTSTAPPSATTPPPAAGVTTTLGGVASKGPMKRALVTAYRLNSDGTLGAAIASTETSASDGSYTLDLGAASGAVQLVVSVIKGKTVMADEASGVDVTLPDDFALHANTVVTAPSDGSKTLVQSASITPFTELAHQIALAAGGLSQANIGNAAKVVFDLIGVDPVATRPLDANQAAPADATDDQKRYALFNAAVSQLAATAPATSDATTLACFAAAGSDAGKKIQCATGQIARSVTVDTSGGSTTAAANRNLLGLGDALVAASGDVKNKTGTVISADDSASKRLKSLETEVRSAADGKASPIKLDVPAQDLADIAKAKQFFSRLRANAAALESGPLDTGLSDGVQALADTVNAQAATVTGDTGRVLRLATIARQLWADYTSGATSDANSLPVAGFSGGCTVYQGEFPSRFGPADAQVGSTGAPGAPYGATAVVVATSATAARWVGCSLNQSPTPTLANGAVQYRRQLLFDMGASSFPVAVPYIAVLRQRRVDGSGALVFNNLTATLSGQFGYATDGANITDLHFSGDLPPGVDANGTPVAARFAVDIDATLTLLDSGALQARLTAGGFAVVPVGAASPSLSMTLSKGGGTVIVLPETTPGHVPGAAELADVKINIAVALTTDRGGATGLLVADRYGLDALGQAQPGHVAFTGRLFAAGTSQAVAEVLTGTLDLSRRSPSGVVGSADSTRTVAFDGSLSLPARPVATLSLSVSEAPATGTAGRTLTLTGRYVQDAVTVQLTGSGNVGSDNRTLTLADSSGVSVTVNMAAKRAAITVSGRNAGSVDAVRDRVTYADGSFESVN
jgi:hypothetical protein